MTDGILLIDKPAGPTSHDIVAAVRRAVGEGRVGHAGTLDPPASGLLVMLVGKATRLARFIALLPKRYVGTVRFGRETSTEDATGETVGELSDGWKTLDEAAVRDAAELVRARPMQLPPAVSAKKIEGKRAYAMARQGEAPDLKPAAVTIHALQISRLPESDADFRLEVACSSGTYIRSIARDIGREVGVPAHLAALRRTGIGLWEVRDAIPYDEAIADTIPAKWHPMSEAVAHLPRLALNSEQADRFAHGQKLPTDLAPGAGPVAVFAGHDLVGIADVEDGLLKPGVVLAG